MDYASLLTLMKARRSIRAFTDAPVSREQIEQLIEAARWAPSNHNRQAWKFLVFDNRAEILHLAEKVQTFLKDTLPHCHPLVREQSEAIILFSGIFQRAPAVILTMHKPAPRVGRSLLETACGPHVSGEVISTAMASQNILLAAEALGLGACIMTAPLLAGPVWQSLEDLPPGFEPTCLIALGHPAQASEEPVRKKIETLIEYRSHP